MLSLILMEPVGEEGLEQIVLLPSQVLALTYPMTLYHLAWKEEEVVLLIFLLFSLSFS